MGVRDRIRAWRLPRWVLEVWIWLTIVGSYLEATGCPIASASDFCTAFSNNFGSYTLSIFPGASQIVFFGVTKQLLVAVILSLAVAALCHFAIRRYLDRRVSVWVVAGLYVAALGLTFVSDVIGIPLMFDTPPWKLWRAMIG